MGNIERTFTLKDVQTILNYGRLEGAPDSASEVVGHLEDRGWITPADQSWGAVEALRDLRTLAIENGIIEARGGYDRTVLLPHLGGQS